jgi:hypothetical protein
MFLKFFSETILSSVNFVPNETVAARGTWPYHHVGLSIRDGTRYCDPPKMVFGTS